MKNLVILVSLAGFLFYQIDAQCSDGWTHRDNYCYYVTKSADSATYTWHTARSHCMENGADLASVNSIEEQNFITETAINSGYTGELWIGLNQLNNKEADYVWSDGTTGTYTYYAVGQPVRDNGLEQCIYTKTKPHAGDCFTRRDGRSTIKGLIDKPEDAAPPDTYHFGHRSEDEAGIQFCQDECGKEAQCHSYTFVSTLSPDATWAGQCVGCSDQYDIDVLDIWSYSGSRTTCHSYQDSGMWYSHNCGVTSGFVCKKTTDSTAPITAPPTDTVNSYCPMGYYSITSVTSLTVPDRHNIAESGNKCYKVFSDRHNILESGKTWDEAVKYCREGPGRNPDLASVDSDLENAEILAALQGYLPGVWLGLHVDQRTGDFVWADNSHTGYTNWAPNRPVETDACAEMVVSNGHPGKWVDTMCDQKRGYVCQTYKDPDNPNNQPPLTTPIQCKSGWQPYWYSCYRFEHSPLSWDDAERNCVSQGAHLVSAHSEVENSAINVFTTDSAPIWIGLRMFSGYYAWTDSWSYSYKKWAGEGPDGSAGDCVEMTIAGEWMTADCSRAMPYVCKYSEGKSLTTPVHEQGECPGTDWLYWGKHCYFIDIGEEAYTWQGARDYCVGKGDANYTVDLASIHSVTENEMVITELNARGSTKGPAWIGLKRENADSDFTWSDGSTSSYTLWAPSEPNSNYHCTALFNEGYTGAWHTSDCEEQKPVICKTQKILYTEPPTDAPVSDKNGCCNAWQVIGITLGSLVVVAFLGFVGFVTFYYFIKPHRPGGTGLSPLDRVHFRNPLASRNNDSGSTQIYDGLNEEYMAKDIDRDAAKVIHSPESDFGVNSGVPAGMSNVYSQPNTDGMLVDTDA